LPTFAGIELVIGVSHFSTQTVSLHCRLALDRERAKGGKLYEIDMIRRRMQGNDVRPVLMINSDILVSNAGEPAIA
jgi:hypothetical protein